jgi:hypothetical protein
MTEFLSKFDSRELLGLVSIVGGLLFTLLIFAGHYWHKVRIAEIAARLKQDMLDRGMSADEIKTVLEAGPRSRWRC